MQITFPIPEFARKERHLHCDVVHITTVWVSRLVLDHAIVAIQTSIKAYRLVYDATVWAVTSTVSSRSSRTLVHVLVG